MSGRYPAPRERSPARHFDRRPSATYTPGPSTYRGTGEPQTSSIDRAPPRGPKADFRGGGYQFGSAPRGRGAFTARAPDTWDRERERDRDARPQQPPYRRDDERVDWPRRDREFSSTERGGGFQRERTYVGRDRSASPDRPRRSSKESVTPTFGRPAESTSSYYAPSVRGGAVRGRGRGDWDRARGRPSFVGERDREFLPRSRSPQDWRDRYDDRGRTTGHDTERSDRFERREYDRGDDRDGRAREHDVWQRDRSPGRNSTGRPASPGALSTVSQHGERYKQDYDTGRKPSLGGPLSARSDTRRETDSDYFASRIETPRREGTLSQQFPAPSVPQSSSIGLDYGPPPSVPATTPSVQEKPAAAKTQPSKVEPLAAPTALQPPSGPKADRVGPPPNAPSTPRAATQQFEPWTKVESAVRAARPGVVLNTAPPSTELGWKSTEAAADSRPALVNTSDRPLPANVPSGPRNPSVNFRTRLLSNEQAPPSVPPTGPRQPKAGVIESRGIHNAPTGPRSSTFPGPSVPHGSPPTGPQAASIRQWAPPEYRPSKPSIMNQMNKPYQADVRERTSISGPSMRPGGVTYQSQQGKPKITQPMSAESASQVLSARAIGLSADTPSGAQTPMDEDMVDSPADIEMSLPPSDDDDVEDDDALDEDYFAASEETHSREMKLLESKKPPPPLLDPATAALLIRIQLLDMIASDIVPEAYENLKDTVETAMDLDIIPSNAPPSPERTPEEKSRSALEHPRPRGRPLSQQVVNPIPTPPIDELPYLNDAIAECHVFDDAEDEAERDSSTLRLCEAFMQDTQDDEGDLEDLHEFYRSKYPQWRREVEQADQRLREIHQPSPAPASPAPSATPSLPPGPDRNAGERTRGARNTTDLDMQQAILMSQQSAKEEEERREREAASSALPNYETEAVVPFMLKPSEMGLSYFEDTNGMVSQETALHVYGFVPPEDDFTDEEQAAFTAAYCQTPKKWGKIADAVPGRTYQDCIMHYYLTKDQANYKELWRRSQPKRGRRRAANVKPRANNLMSDLALNEEGEGTPVAVTDSGRPRRAAAPTFGDVPEAENTSAPPQAKRLKETLKDSDPAMSKPRGRKGTGTGKGRKAKEKVLVDQVNQMLLPAGVVDGSPQKLDRNPAVKDKLGRTSLKAENIIPKPDPLGMQALNAQVSLEVGKLPPGEMSSSNLGSAPVQVTSYWSVPEQQKFPFLVQYFGRDYSAIAAFLKTKSPIMIKNYYMREVNNGKVELEQLANVADEKRAKGEQMGPPPTPVQPPKRRYEATPSMAAIPRTAPIANEQQMSEADSMGPVLKASNEEFSSGNFQRVVNEMGAKPRAAREIVHHSPISSHVHPKVEEPVRSDRPSLLQKPLQGPPRGFFQDEPSVFLQQHTKLAGPTQEASPHQRPVQIIDHRPGEARSQPSTQHVEVNSRGILPQGREQLVQPSQTASIQQYQQVSDRPLQHPRLASHSRHSSLITSHIAPSNHEQAAADLASLRNMDHSRSMAFNPPPAHSPIPMPAQTTMAPKTESHAPMRPVVATSVEPPKPMPFKRSDVFNILNDDPPEPSKSTQLEGLKRNAVNTPPPTTVPPQTSLIPPRHQDESSRSGQPSYGHHGRIDPIRQEYRQDYSSSPAPGHQSETWLDRWDPRQANQGHDRAAQPSPAPGTYSVVPPSSQSSPVASIHRRYDPARNLEPSNHRRSLLSIDQTSSSPTQQQQQPVHLQRSSSGSSQHARASSTTYSQSAASATATYPHSTAPTPVPGLQHRSQHSFDQPRQTIQQHLREREQAIHARRDVDIMHQQPPPPPQAHAQQPPSQPQSRMSDRRDIYGTMQEPRQVQHHIPPPASQTPQPQSMGLAYSTAPPNRTFTPPLSAYGPGAGVSGHTHGHHTHQQQQYQPHQSQYSRVGSQDQGSTQHHQAFQSHPGYGPPPSQQHPHQRSGHPLGVNPQSQPQGHYRGYSTGERR